MLDSEFSELLAQGQALRRDSASMDTKPRENTESVHPGFMELMVSRGN